MSSSQAGRPGAFSLSTLALQPPARHIQAAAAPRHDGSGCGHHAGGLPLAAALQRGEWPCPPADQLDACTWFMFTIPDAALQAKSFAGSKVAPFRPQRAVARQQSAIVCAGETCSRLRCPMRGPLTQAATGRHCCRCTPLINLSLHAAATAELKKMGPDLWNDTYYPTASDAANVFKQWCVSSCGCEPLSLRVPLLLPGVTCWCQVKAWRASG